NNTPRQINILEALGAPRPVYAHLPMINGTDGKKLSKRHGAISVLEYEKEGILPQALLNYLVRLGWSHGDQEIFSLEEMIANFDIDDVNKSAGCFDPDKLKWVNQQYIQAMPTDELAAAAAPFFAGIGADLTQGPPLGEVVNALRERAQTLVELAERGAPYYMDVSEFEAQA
ncbi:MAG: glutamate--tRNA ligase, partial [Gammaproteobacteria bacterium]|nr:glutamate--tRNA ligase [Gammaproteobacteria bacterium]